MLVISDIHFALDALRREVDRGELLLLLGDFVNLTDYRTGEGAIADVLGMEFARQAGDARAGGDFKAMRRLWEQAAGDRSDDVRSAIRSSIADQYGLVSAALADGRGYVIHGNVDQPGLLQDSLPPTLEYVHGETRVIEGVTFGFVGGGIETPLNAEGEVTDEEMHEILAAMGPVDVLCTHVPPAVDALRTDVITGRNERGSEPILEYIRVHQPRLHLFGDVHQPQASTWRIGRTNCRNVGYFRATGRAFEINLTQNR